MKRPGKIALEKGRFDLLQYSRLMLGQILPHVEVGRWKWVKIQKVSDSKTTNARLVNSKKEIEILLDVLWRYTDKNQNTNLRSDHYRLRLKRKPVPSKIKRILGIPDPVFNSEEKDICDSAANILNRIYVDLQNIADCTFYVGAIRSKLDEIIISTHLKTVHGIKLDIRHIFERLHKLAEQTYENKAYTFGCLIEPTNAKKHSNQGSVCFPNDYLKTRKFCVLSDGFKTAYRVTTDGCLLKLEKLTYLDRDGKDDYFPEWARPLATACNNGVVGISLTRQGDICVFIDKRLTFTYRQGNWQYWNHDYLIVMLRELAKTRRVGLRVINAVIRTVYRSALDISFKRTGALFVVLNNRRDLRKIVRVGDAINDERVNDGDKGFDGFIKNQRIQRISKAVLAELASLDGAVVLNNHGEIKAYGSVLKTKKVSGLDKEDGSRGKAAIVSSYLGWVVKISADGGIKVFNRGVSIIEI